MAQIMDDFQPLHTFSTLAVTFEPTSGVAMVTLNRPQVSNAMNMDMVSDLPAAAQALSAHSSVRCIVLCGAGRNFCSGLDLSTLQEVTRGLLGREGHCPAETRRAFLAHVKRMQVWR